MRSKRRNRVITMWRLVFVTVCATAFLLVFKDTYYRWKGGRWLNATTAQPTLALGALVNGSPAHPAAEVNIVQGSSITPTLEIDWGAGPAGSVELTFLGRVVPAGEPIVLSEPGSYRLAAEAHTGRWSRARSITFEVTEFPRLRAAVAVDRFDRDPFELVLRLSGEAFDLERANPASIYLALIDARNKPMDRYPLATAPDGSPDARFTGSEWILRFTRPADAPRLAATPARIILSGLATRGDERIEIVADAALPAAELP